MLKPVFASCHLNHSSGLDKPVNFLVCSCLNGSDRNFVQFSCFILWRVMTLAVRILSLLWPERRITHLLPETFIWFTSPFVILNSFPKGQKVIDFPSSNKLSGNPLSALPWSHWKYAPRCKKSTNVGNISEIKIMRLCSILILKQHNTAFTLILRTEGC